MSAVVVWRQDVSMMLSQIATASLALVCVLGLARPSHAQGIRDADVYEGCDAHFNEPGRVFHVSPNGEMSLADAIAKARGGDSIYLKGGDYGSVVIAGINTAFVTVAAEPGQTALFEHLAIGRRHSASHWLIKGIEVVGLVPPGLDQGQWDVHPSKINVSNSDNIVILDTVIGTSTGTYPWQQEVRGSPTPHPLTSGIDVENSSCVALTGDHIENVFDGITVGGDQVGSNGKRILIQHNEINGFAGDGIDHSASQLLISDNLITNAHDICADTCIHTDGIQGWNYHDRAGLINTDILIRRNIIISDSQPSVLLPADDLHGITIFDGNWDKVSIINNVVVTTTWHGISVYGGTNIDIIDNTVVGTNPKRNTWIMLNHQKGHLDEPPTHDLVRNNVAQGYIFGQGKPVVGVTHDHNLQIKSLRGVFRVMDVDDRRYDLHPSARSLLVGRATLEGAPIDDANARLRVGLPTVGAFGQEER